MPWISTGNIKGAQGPRGLPGAGVDSIDGTGQDPNAQELAGGFTDQNGRATQLVVRTDGTVPDNVLLEWAPRLAAMLATATSSYDKFLESGRGVLAPSSGGPQAFVSDPTRLSAWGDSLTQGWPRPPFAGNGSDSWPGVLDAAWAGSVMNAGVAGQSADEIALRQGGYLLQLTPANGQIAASGQTAMTTTQLYGFRTNGAWSCDGYVIADGGVRVYGTIARTGVGGGTFDPALAKTFTFTRATAGDAVTVPSVVTFYSTAGELAKDTVQVLYAGRNDIGWPITGAEIVKRVVLATMAMKDRPGVKQPRRLVVGTINSTNEKSGSTNYAAVVAINQQLAALYPDAWFDLRAYVVNQVIYDLGITPTSLDLLNMAGDAPPPSIMSNYTTDANGTPTSWDGVHYSPATAAKIAAKLQSVLTAKGWII